MEKSSEYLEPPAVNHEHFILKRNVFTIVFEAYDNALNNLFKQLLGIFYSESNIPF